MDDNNVQTEPEPQTRRGRKPKVSTRRNYARELRDMESRVEMAVKLLKRIHNPPELVAVAIEILDEA